MAATMARDLDQHDPMGAELSAVCRIAAAQRRKIDFGMSA